MSRLICFVHVADDKGDVQAFGPGSTVPEWARKKITNPNVWASQAPVQTVEAVVVPGGAASMPSAAGGTGGAALDGPPPQGGAGASRQKWADYATSKGVTVEADWKREDIIAACELAGVPV